MKTSNEESEIEVGHDYDCMDSAGGLCDVLNHGLENRAKSRKMQGFDVV